MASHWHELGGTATKCGKHGRKLDLEQLVAAGLRRLATDHASCLGLLKCTVTETVLKGRQAPMLEGRSVVENLL